MPKKKVKKKRKPYVTRRRFGSGLKTTTAQGKRDYQRGWMRAKRKADKFKRIKDKVLGRTSRGRR